MLVIMYLGMGVSTIACGLIDSNTGLLWGLISLGLFAAIYHPVGISWLVRSSTENTGKKLALNGLFGGLGVAAAGGISGWILVSSGWRLAFFIPGTLCLICGLVMWWLYRQGRFENTPGTDSSRPESVIEPTTERNGFVVLLLPMFSIGLIYTSIQALMPKLFEEQAVSLLSGNLALIGSLVAVVYVAGALMQLVGGWLADKFSLRKIYILFWISQPPLLLAMMVTQNISLIIASIAVVVCHTAALPAENLLVARYSPRRHQGLAFGVKFVLAFGAGPLAVELIAAARKYTGGFEPLFVGLSILAVLACLTALLLPRMGQQHKIVST